MTDAGREAGFDASVDVLVVGAGGCGLVAAIAADAAGASVAVVEKMPRLMGNTMLSSGSIPAAGTRFQRECGVADDAARFAADLARAGGRHEAMHLVERLAGISAELVEWLVDVARVELTLVTAYRHVGHSVNRLHAPPSRRGRDLMRDLLATVEARAIPVAFGNPAVELIVSPRHGFTGAVTATPRGERARIGAGAVVLACNGFGANRDLLARFCPEIAGHAYAGAPGSEGEAVLWGERLGARLGNMGAYQAHASLADPHGSLVTWTVIEKGGVIVDRTGRRFGDETKGYSAFAADELARAGPFVMIYDDAIRDATAAGQGEFADLRDHGGCIEAAGAAEIAARFGLDGQALAATLAGAAAAARGASDDPFGRREWGLGALRAPFVATRIAPALFHTQGGLLVDDEARVLSRSGAVIAGLHAGGGAACGISGARGSLGYASGNGLLAALGLGLLAGRAAGRQAPTRRAILADEVDRPGTVS